MRASWPPALRALAALLEQAPLEPPDQLPSTGQCEGLFRELLLVDWVTRHQMTKFIQQVYPLLYLRLLTMFDTTQHLSGIHSGRPPDKLPSIMQAQLERGPRQLTIEESLELSWRLRR